MNRESFIFYRSFYEAIKDLPRDVQGEVYTAIMEYSLNGITTESLKPIARSIFTLVKPQLDANIQRFENGKKGGRPPKEETEQKPNDNQDETESKPNYNVNDNYNYNDKEIDTNVSTKKEVETSSHPLSEFERYEIWIKENATYCSKHLKQLSEKEYNELRKTYAAKKIADTILQIENRKDLRKKYSNLYRTLLNWLKKNHEEQNERTKSSEISFPGLTIVG